LQQQMESGAQTARSITQLYLDRIAAIDAQGPSLKSVIEVNPDALAIADALDQERKSGKVRGPLHGIPVLIKDNIDTADKMMTTAGSLALEGNRATKDAFIVARLREAGAVLLGKTNLSEFANFRSSRSSSGWSSRGGQTRNPYVLSRNPCGSSSGSGVAVSANLCALAIGTETDGSIVCPASVSGIVGIKPTVGLWSRSGIIPISHTQDTAGPMARTVTDAVILLGPLTGADAADKTTAESTGKAHQDYTQFLDANGLKGKRIGVEKSFSRATKA
jgi:amidase